MSESQKFCRFCGAPLTGRRTAYCNSTCQSKAQAVRRRTGKPRPASPIYTERACQDCGTVLLLHIKSKRCPSCQRAANQRADAAHYRRKRSGVARQIGSVDLCERCGRPYTVMGSLQLYCKDCAPIAYKANDQKTSRELARAKLSDEAYCLEHNARRKAQWKSKADECSRACVVCGKTFRPSFHFRMICSAECQKKRQRSQEAAYRARKKEVQK